VARKGAAPSGQNSVSNQAESQQKAGFEKMFK
jgi:hypothetical protein